MSARQSCAISLRGVSNTRVNKNLLGRTNPNCKYPTLQDNFFGEIDTEEKAYILGWIASDGSVQPTRIAIAIHKKDECVLKQIRDAICKELPIRPTGATLQFRILRLHSKQMSQDVCKWLKIKPGKKYDTVSAPDLPRHLMGHFFRGFMDGDGHISKTFTKKGHLNSPLCQANTVSANMRRSLEEFSGKGTCRVDNLTVTWNGNNALDFLGKIYEGATLYLPRKRDAYLDWACWVPCLSGRGNRGSTPHFKWNKTDPNAVPPFKKNVSDSGYDLTLIKKVKDGDGYAVYDTGIKVQPSYGWWFMLVPRSSLYKTKHMMMNSAGIIDRTYNGNVMAVLWKTDASAPDLELPCRGVQIIPLPAVHIDGVEIHQIDDSSRGEGGFGSTGT